MAGITDEDCLDTLTDYLFHNLSVQELLDKYTDQWQDGDDITKALDKAYRNIRKDNSKMSSVEIRRAYYILTGEDPDNAV